VKVIPKINLDDRTFDDIFNDALRLIPRYCPEWTNHNTSDPGITLLELFSWMTEMTIYRLNKVPDKTYLSLLELMGLSLITPQSARAIIRFFPVEGIYKDIEIKVAKVLANMEFEGIHVSKKALEDMSDELDERIKILEASIHTLAGSEFNIASPKQLGIVLFEDLGLPPVKKTKTGYSTSVEVLEQLQHSHEIIPLIMEYIK